jgi:hypothetical protein
MAVFDSYSSRSGEKFFNEIYKSSKQINSQKTSQSILFMCNNNNNNNNIHLMYALEGNSEFCFPDNLNVSRDEVEGNIEIRGKTKFTIYRGSIH